MSATRPASTTPFRGAPVLAAAVIAAAALPGLAQEGASSSPAPPSAPQPTLDPNEGRLLRDVRLVRPVRGAEARLEPVPEATANLARNQIRSEVGRPYRAEAVREDVRRLARLGSFHTVETYLEPQADGTVVLTFVLVERPVIQDVQCVGNRVLSDQEILAEADILVGTPVEASQIDRACRRIEALYTRKGYYLARVEKDDKVLEETGVLILRIREGERVKVTDIRFEGNKAFTPRELKTAIRTRVAFPIFEKGPLDDDVLTDDTAALVAFCRDRGYLDARADRRVQLSPDNREAIVTFLIDEGPLYTLKHVRVRYTDRDTVERVKLDVLNDPASPITSVTPEQARAVGAGVYSEAQIGGLMGVKPGDAYGVRAVEQGVRAVADAYGQLGYTDARVELRREVRELDRPEVGVVLFIAEGKRHRTGEVIIQGNPITRSEVIARQVQVRPDRPLDTTAVEETRRRLAQLRLFDPAPGKVTVTLLPPEDDHRDVLVEVAETNTGSFNFGVGVNSDAGVIGTLSIRQRNFDVTNVPRSWDQVFGGGAFRGAGQDFDITLAPGDRTQEYSMGLTEPYFLESDYSLGGRVYYTARAFREYDVERYGGRVELGRRFGSRLRADLTFRNEWAELSDIEPDAPTDYFDSADQRLISGLGLRLSRSTTDRPIVPTRGTRVAVAAEQVGLLNNDVWFTKFSTDYSAYFTLNETFEGLRTVLAVSLKADWIPQDPGDVPTYERFYLGGRTMRGLALRTVSPRGVQQSGAPADEPVGGLWSFFAGTELQVPVHEVVSFAFFVDSGTVLNDPGLTDYRVCVGAGLRLNVPVLTQVPLAFDFGVPLLKESTDRTRFFTFSLDIPF